VREICKLFDKALASLIFATFSIAQTSLALHSLNAKIGLSGGIWGFDNVFAKRVGFKFQIYSPFIRHNTFISAIYPPNPNL